FIPEVFYNLNEFAFFSIEKPLQFGHYQILQELGRGGMGIVYKAYHANLKQVVALKVILAGEQASEKTLQRFQREIETMAKLNHPGIVQILDSGKENQQYYFAMEFVSGVPLKEYQAPLREIIILFKKILEGLACAHQQNIIHRDLKLDNILVTPEGNPKILDFGLAKDLSSIQEDQKLTHTGTILGSGHYMPPEQASGEISQLSPRSDVYAIGVCLYRILAKRFPFDAPSFPQLLSKIINEEICPPSFFEKNIHPDLEAILLKALEKEPQKRYANAQEFATDLERFLNGCPVLARPLSFLERSFKNIKRNKMLVVLPSFAFLSLILAIGIFYQVRIQEQHKIFDFHYQNAIEALSKSEDARKQKNFLVVSQYDFQALNALNRALVFNPRSRSIEILQQKIGQDLLDLAYQYESFQLAEFVLQLMTSIESIPNGIKEIWQNEFEREKQKHKKYHLQRFDFWITHLKTMNWNLSATREKAIDAIYEISKMSEPEILESLTQLLKEAHQYFLNATPHNNSPHYLFYIWVAEVTRRQENEKMIPVLLEGFTLFQARLEEIVKSQNVSKIQFFIPLFEALGDLSATQAIPLLEEFRWYLQDKANFDRRTQRIYLKLLEKKPKDSHLLETEEEYRYQGLQKLEKKEYSSAIQNLTNAIQINPLIPENYNLRGLARYRLKDYNGAIRDFSQSLDLKPDYLDALNNRGLAKADIHDLSGALEDFNEAILLTPEDASLYSNRGNVYSLQENFQRAISDFTSAIHYDSSSLKAYYNRGNIYNDQEYYEKALIDFNMVLKLDPEFSEAYNSRGNTKKLLGNLTGALSDYTQAIRLDPKNACSYGNRGELKQLQEDIQGALSDYEEALRLDPNFIDVYQLRANLYRELGSFEDAAHDFDTLIQLQPNEGEHYYLRGLVQAQLGGMDQALADFNHALELKSKNPEIYLARGMAHKDLKNFSKALEDLNQFIQLQPDQSLGYIYRGEVKKSLKEMKGALADFNFAIQIEPESTRAFLARGLFCYSEKAWKRALIDFAQMIKLDPYSSEAYFHRGKTKYQLQDFSGAVLDFDQAIQKNPKYTQAYYERGLTQHSQKKREEAKKDFTIFLKRTQKSTSRKVLRQRKKILKLYPELDPK
ncbi:MAG: tetratricopeptide repeat protein, partial [Planctomycetota bacterium]